MNNVVRQDRGFAFALRIFELYQYLCREKKEYVMSKQMLLSGTYVGASIVVPCHALSEHYLTNISTAYQEAQKTIYCLHLLNDTGFLTNEQCKAMSRETEDMCQLIGELELRYIIEKQVKIRN
jgi:four helix bundle protein